MCHPYTALEWQRAYRGAVQDFHSKFATVLCEIDDDLTARNIHPMQHPRIAHAVRLLGRVTDAVVVWESKAVQHEILRLKAGATGSDVFPFSKDHLDAMVRWVDGQIEQIPRRIEESCRCLLSTEASREAWRQQAWYIGGRIKADVERKYAEGRADWELRSALATSGDSDRNRVSPQDTVNVSPSPAVLVLSHESQRSAARVEDQREESMRKLLRVFTNGLSDERLVRAAELLQNVELTTNEKLTKIDALIQLPATASAENLGELFGVTKQAVMKTDWWIQNRKGEKASEVGQRRNTHRERAQGYEENLPSDKDE